MIKLITTSVIFPGKFHYISGRSCCLCPLIFIIFLRHQTISIIVYHIRKLICLPRTWVINRACRIQQRSGTSRQCRSACRTRALIKSSVQRQIFGSQEHLRFDILYAFIIRTTLDGQIIITGSIIQSFIR